VWQRVFQLKQSGTPQCSHLAVRPGESPPRLGVLTKLAASTGPRARGVASVLIHGRQWGCHADPMQCRVCLMGSCAGTSALLHVLTTTS